MYWVRKVDIIDIADELRENEGTPTLEVYMTTSAREGGYDPIYGKQFKSTIKDELAEVDGVLKPTGKRIFESERKLTRHLLKSLHIIDNRLRGLPDWQIDRVYNVNKLEPFEVDQDSDSADFFNLLTSLHDVQANKEYKLKSLFFNRTFDRESYVMGRDIIRFDISYEETYEANSTYYTATYYINSNEELSGIAIIEDKEWTFIEQADWPETLVMLTDDVFKSVRFGIENGSMANWAEYPLGYL